MTEPNPPLAGVRVLELTRGIAGQAAGMLLADLGAEVVRPVLPGDADRWNRPGWLCWNRGKVLVAHDADPVEDTRQLRRLAARADLLVADAQPGWLEVRGLDQATTGRDLPALCHLWMPPTGARGRFAGLPHDDLLLSALSGFAAHHPATREVPVASVAPTILQMHGALAAGSALAALVARERDGWGRAATVSGLMAQALVLCTLITRTIDGTPTIGSGKGVTGAPQFRLYQGSDGRWFYLAALSPDLFFRALDAVDRMDVMVREDVAGEFTNLMHPDVSEAVGAELQKTFSERTAQEWLDLFGESDVPAAPVGDPDWWLGSEIIAAACPPLTRHHPDVGEVRLPGVPVILSDTPPRPGELPREDELADLAAVWRDVEPLPPPSGDRPDPGELPLSGVRVLDTATFVAGPSVSTLLANHGADVVKVEGRTGDPYGFYTASYAAINVHKRRIRLDLREEADRRTFLELVAGADVVVDNLLPASLERLGLPPEVFETANPRLVRCSVTAYGQTGPWAEFPGFDPIVQSLSGLVSLQGGDGRPVATAAPVNDAGCGSLGAVATLAALFHRARTGAGQRAYASLAATSTFLQSGELTSYEGRPPRVKGGEDFAGPAWWRHLYEAADGRWIAVAARTPEEQEAMLGVIGRRDAAGAGDPGASDAELTEACAAWVAERTAEDAVTSLAVAAVPACPAINRYELEDPFLRENGYSGRVDTDNVGALELLGGFTDWRGVPRRPPTWPDVDTTPEAVSARWR